MTDTWNRFVYDLIACAKNDVVEADYHAQIESQLQLLGWAKYNGEINHKENLHMGNNGWIQPDILIGRAPNWCFAIEVKRPSHSQTAKDRDQLKSYLRQLKLSVGLYFGEHIEVFYDQPNANADLCSVYRIPLELNHPKGDRFVTLFSKEGFSHEALAKFCESRIEEQKIKDSLRQIRNYLISKESHEELWQYILNGLSTKHNGRFTREQLADMIKGLHLEITTEAQNQASHPASSAPSTVKPTVTNKRDTTRYSFDGKEGLGKNHLALEIVRKYITSKPGMRFEEYAQVLKPEWQGSYGVIQTLRHITASHFKGNRYFTQPEHVFQDHLGERFAVCTQWGSGNIGNLIAFAKTMGWPVVADSKGTPQNRLQEERAYLYINNKGIHAIGRSQGERFVVQAGSTVVEGYTQSYRQKEERQRLLQEHAEHRGNNFVVTHDITFNSPSRAASFCLGTPTDGMTCWKDANGRSLKEIKGSKA